MSQDELRAEFRALLHEKMRTAIWLRLAATLEDEIEGYIGAARYARTPTRRDRRNGYYARDLVITAGKDDVHLSDTQAR